MSPKGLSPPRRRSQAKRKRGKRAQQVFVLKRRHRAATHPVQHNAPSGIREMEAKKILIIDDNRVMLKFLSGLLERQGHQVTTAEDGFAALNLLTASHPDIIIVDLILPKIGGDKLCQIIRKMKHLENCFIIVLSAAVAEMDFDDGQFDADACIAKGPFASMADHVLEAVAQASAPRTKDQPAAIMGLEGVYARRMTKELLSRNQHLETILESIAEGILELYAQRIVYANSAAKDLVGLPQEKLLTASPQDLFDPSVRPQIEALITSDPDEVAEIGHQAPVDLNNRLLTIKKLPVKGEDKTSILLLNDVTDRKRLEFQLQHAQKMEAIGTIASGVAHNFRNTLAGILVNNQVLQIKYHADAEAMKITERISTAVKRGAELVEGLLQFSRKQAKNQFHRIDLSDVITEVVQIVRDSFDKKIEIQFDKHKSLPVRGDHSGLSQALMNLCTNARDAMAGGGRLRIEARATDAEAIVAVSDTGRGMDATVRARCFDPFFTTKEVGKGTGLGLSTTYGIVRAHGGHIEVSSEPGRGSVFTIHLPLVSSSGRTDTQAAVALIRGQGQTVMVVDDEAALLEAMPELLSSLGYKAMVAANAFQAIEMYRQQRPDIVLMDRNMPEMDGIRCAEQIVALDPHATIAIISGYDIEGPDGIAEDKRHLIKGYLTKPLGLRELSTMLNDLLHSAMRDTGRLTATAPLAAHRPEKENK